LESHVDCALNVFTMYPVGIWAPVPSVSEKESGRDDEGKQTSEYSREEMIGSLQRRGLMRDLLRDGGRDLGDEVKDVGTG